MSRAASTTPAPVGSLRPIGTTGYGGRGERERAAAVRAALAAGAPTPRVAIIGAGAAGLCMAIRLRDAGIDSFTIYEKSDGVGGTWRDNTYPGAACDVPSHLYSFSFASKRDWTRRFAGQPEILGYFESLVDRFDLSGHLRLGTEVTEAHYDDATGTWTLRTATSDGEPSEGTSAGTVVADVVVSGLGQLNRPYVPDIPGLDAFVEGGGTVFHSARWDHDHDLSEDRVGVVGIGASAIQFVPPVAASAAHTTLFQRSANYVGPRNDREFTPRERWIFENVPGAQKAYRESIYWRFEARFNVMRAGSRLGRWMQGQFRKGLQPMVSERLPEAALVPDYPVGCKRILIADDWYPTLLRPDVDVVTSGIERIEDGAVLTDDGRRTPVDTLIFGTGFRSTEFLSPLKITGRSGRDLNEVWVDGARAYMGLAVPGFPNLFMLYGPNTNLGHNSILFMIEAQVRLIVQLVDAMVRERRTSVEVDPLAFEASNRDVRERLAASVWATGCESWYKNAAGTITNNWPGSTLAYWRRLRTAKANDWRFSGRAGR